VQRALHRSLAEINFRLLHEQRLRRGKPTFREARRLEQLISPAELEAVTIAGLPTAAQLRRAAQKAATTFRRLVRHLVANAWVWPPTLPLRLRAE
jgi:hypothetical protein